MLKMVKKIEPLLDAFDTAIEKLGKGFSLIIILVMAVIMFEVIARYAFNSPTIWAWPITKQLFGVFILFGGIYTLLHGGHIKVEMFYNRFPSKMKFTSRLIALLCALLFLGVLAWLGGVVASNSLVSGEYTSGAFRIPLYPFKMLLPIAATLFCLQGIVNFLRGRD
jgi:TRAP-type mannitol/chloroaromatic compound transport system permease small subunit